MTEGSAYVVASQFLVTTKTGAYAVAADAPEAVRSDSVGLGRHKRHAKNLVNDLANSHRYEAETEKPAAEGRHFFYLNELTSFSHRGFVPEECEITEPKHPVLKVPDP